MGLLGLVLGGFCWGGFCVGLCVGVSGVSAGGRCFGCGLWF